MAGSHVSQERALYCSRTNLWKGTQKHVKHRSVSTDAELLQENCLPEHIRRVIRVQRVGVLAVEELVRLDRRHVQVQGSLWGGRVGE